jgi:hypothetical protein
VLRDEFLREASRLHPEMLDQLLPAADLYCRLYENWRHLQATIHPQFHTAPRWPPGVILHPGVGSSCPVQHRALREALNAWAKEWHLLDDSGLVHAWVLDNLWVTFLAWMVPGRPKVFHSYLLVGGGVPRDLQTVSPQIPWDPLGRETKDVVLERIIFESKSRMEQIVTQAERHFTLTTTERPEYLTWSAQRHFDQMPYELIADKTQASVRHVQNIVTRLLREIGLGQRPGRPLKLHKISVSPNVIF